MGIVDNLFDDNGRMMCDESCQAVNSRERKKWKMNEHQIKEFDNLIDLLEELDRAGISGYHKQEIYKRYLNFRARMRGQVYTGGFELTPLCNLDCKMCYVHLTKGQMEQEAKLLTTQQWIQIMQQAVDAGMMHADLTGGECLSYPGFQEVYLYLRSRGVDVSILTNGQLITEEMADFFAQYPPSVVQITVYGSDEDSYERVTGRRAFADVSAAIERLKKRNIRLFLTVTPNRYMQEDTHALLEFLRSQNVRYGIGTGSLPAHPNTGRDLKTYAPEADLYVKLHLDEQSYWASFNHFQEENRSQVDYVPIGFRQSSQIPCSSGLCAFHINWKGEMSPCIPFYSVNRSVLEYGFEDCWNWIKHQMAQYEPPEACKNCANKSVCVSCPAERTFGVLNGPLNRAVCERYEQYIHAGILQLPREEQCI